MPVIIFITYGNYRKRLSDTWWLLSMRLRTRLVTDSTYFWDAEAGLAKHAYL